MRFPIALATLIVLSAGATRAEEWSHFIAPYAWGAALDAKVKVGGHESDADASFSELLEDLELAALVRHESHCERWGVLVDGIYMGIGQGIPKTSAELDFDMTMLEVAGSYHATKRLEVIFGARGVSLTGTADADLLPDQSETDTWVDAIAGVRVKLPISRKWRWSLRADVGAGGSDDTWNVETGVSWDATERMSVAVGWRVLAFDRESASVAFDGTLSGPELGVAFRF